MTGNEDAVVGIAIAVAVVAGIGAGIYLLGKLLGNPYGDVTVYRCPNCGLVVRRFSNNCPRCKQVFKWG